jgi:hypothetical protein
MGFIVMNSGLRTLGVYNQQHWGYLLESMIMSTPDSYSPAVDPWGVQYNSSM